MSDQEFEKYLAILGGLLRLDSARREEIAAELRDHLEERLSELIARGFSRDRAIVMALEEFGDAAGLAGEFLHLFRRQRRRWVMKLTVSSVAACVAVLFVIAAIWPENVAPPGPPTLVAQDDDGSQQRDEGKKRRSPRVRQDADATASDPFGEPPPVEERKVRREADEAASESDPSEAQPTVEENNDVTERKLTKRIAANYPNIALNDVLADISKRLEIEILLNRNHIEQTVDVEDTSIDLDLKSVRGEMLLDIVLGQNGLVYTIRDGIVVVTTPEDLESTLEVRVYNCRDLMFLAQGYSSSGMSGVGMDSMGMGMGMGMMSSGGGSDSYGERGEGAEGPGAGPNRKPQPGGMPRAGMMPGMQGMMPGMPGMAGMAMDGGGDMGGMMGAMDEGMGGGMPTMPGRTPHGVGELNALIGVITSTVFPDSWEARGGPGTIEAYYGGLLIVNNNPQAHRKIDKLLSMMRDATKQRPGSVVREK